MISINKQSIRLRSGHSGFSLVETIIYLAIVGVLLTAVVSLHLTLAGTSDKLTSNILASRSRRVALSSIDYLVKNADGLLRDVNGECLDFAATPPELALYFGDDTYLPGTCVGSGGGVRISVVDKKTALTCYPNMSGNGYYQNCDISAYPSENVYYLTSEDVAVLDSSLSFATSTVTSTANNFLTVTTNLSVGTHISNQVRLTATSTATSTTNVKNDQASGLISWWSLDTGPGTILDRQENTDINCTDSANASTLINDGTSALDFEETNTNFCFNIDANLLSFNDSFSITTWLKLESLTVDRPIINLVDASVTKTGYQLLVNTSGNAVLKICDSDTCSDYTSSFTMSTGTTYHIAVTYDLANDEIIFYKVGGTQATSTSSSLKILVNYNSTFIIGADGVTYYDGILDDIRMYNRVLSPDEVNALQSQGAV